MRPLSEVTNQSSNDGTTTPTDKSPFLFKPVKEESDGTVANGKTTGPAVRTRQAKTTGKGKSKVSAAAEGSSTSPEPPMDKNGSKSPGPNSKRSATGNVTISPKTKRKRADEEEDDGTDADVKDGQTSQSPTEEMDSKDNIKTESDGGTISKSPVDESVVKNEKSGLDQSNSNSMDSSTPVGLMDESSIRSRDSILTQPPSVGDNLSSTDQPTGLGQLITPKLEPGSSPPPQNHHSSHSSSSSTTSESIQRRINALASGDRSSPNSSVRVKQEERTAGQIGHGPPFAPHPMSASSIRPSSSPSSQLPQGASLSAATTTTSSVPSAIPSIGRPHSPGDVASQHQNPFAPRGIHFPPFMAGMPGALPQMHAGRPPIPSPNSDRNRDRSGDQESSRRDSSQDSSASRSENEKRGRSPSAKDGQKSSSSADPSRLTPSSQSGLMPPGHHPGLSPFMTGPGGFPGMMPGMVPISSRGGPEMFLHPSFTTMAGNDPRLAGLPPGHPAFGAPGFPPGHPAAMAAALGGFGPGGYPFPFAPGLPPYFTHPFFAAPPARLGFPPQVPGQHPVPAPSPTSKSKESPGPRSSDHHHHRSSVSSDPGGDRGRESAMDDDEPEPASVISRGPSPDPKVEDSECHRSQSAMYVSMYQRLCRLILFLTSNSFLKHWNRGDFNSCARTDLTFKPVPDSQLARRREERARKAADKEREEQKVVYRCLSERFINRCLKAGHAENVVGSARIRWSPTFG